MEAQEFLLASGLGSAADAASETEKRLEAADWPLQGVQKTQCFARWDGEASSGQAATHGDGCQSHRRDVRAKRRLVRVRTTVWTTVTAATSSAQSANVLRLPMASATTPPPAEATMHTTPTTASLMPT